MKLRREFELVEEDCAFLNDAGYQWETVIDGSHWLLLHKFSTICPGYKQETLTVAIRIETGYPNAGLDMMYFFPAITRRDGQPVSATQARQRIDGKIFQRWSRHYSIEHLSEIVRSVLQKFVEDHYIVDVSRLEIHICAIEGWLMREFLE